MKTVITILTSLTTLIVAGQSGKLNADFVTSYFQDNNVKDFEAILSYYDSINDNFIEAGHCWKYCIDIHVDSNQVLFNGDSLKNLEELPNLLYAFLINPKKFKFGHGENENYGTKGRIEIHFNKSSVEIGRTVAKLALQAMKQYTTDLEQKGILSFDSKDLGQYVLNHMTINNKWTAPKPPEFEKIKTSPNNK